VMSVPFYTQLCTSSVIRPERCQLLPEAFAVDAERFATLRV
jgi:hypothetical protein